MDRLEKILDSIEDANIPLKGLIYTKLLNHVTAVEPQKLSLIDGLLENMFLKHQLKPENINPSTKNNLDSFYKANGIKFDDYLKKWINPAEQQKEQQQQKQ